MSYLLLLGVGDERLAGSLRARLGELPDMQISSVERSSGDVTAALADQPSVEVLLLHEGLGPIPPFQLIKDMALRHPHLAIVLAVSEMTTDTFNSAMQAGARVVVSTQPTLDELQTSISTAAEWSRSMRRHLDSSLAGGPLPGRGGTVIAVSGAKGGTGATTLAVHLAVVASGARRTVCLVDMDLQGGDVPSYLDLTHRRSIADLAEVADDLNPTVLSDTLFVHPIGPHVLLAPAEGERGEEVTERVARQVLASLRSRYEILVVDCGAHMTEAGAMAVEMADRVLVTTTPDMPALRATRRLAKLWSRLQVRKEDQLEVVLTRTSRHNEIQPDFARKVLQLPVLRTSIPSAFRALEAAANTGVPTSVADDNFRRAMGGLAAEVGVVQAQAPGGGQQPQKQLQGSGRRRQRGRDTGQSTIEFVGILPLVLFVLLLVEQVVLFGITFISAGHAANEAAHAAAIGKSEKKVEQAALQRIPWGWEEEAQVHWKPGDEYVRVEIATPVVLPGVVFAPWPVQSEARVVYEG